MPCLLPMTCNWYWGSHGCDLEAGHDGDHFCGTEDVPCCRHDGSRVRYFYYQHLEGGYWSPTWSDMEGFCSPITDEGVPVRPCADRDHCRDVGEIWHDDPARVADLFIEDLQSSEQA